MELESLSGDMALLHSTNWQRGENLVATYTNDTTPTLQSLIGEQAAGTWALRVRDLAGYDTGTLDRWAISLTASLGEGVAAPSRSKSKKPTTAK